MPAVQQTKPGGHETAVYQCCSALLHWEAVRRTSATRIAARASQGGPNPVQLKPARAERQVISLSPSLAPEIFPLPPSLSPSLKISFPQDLPPSLFPFPLQSLRLA
eukprot:3936242-Rhodomonas_salina.1